MKKQIFSCGHCGAQYPKWVGRCAECGKWGSVSLEQGAVAEQRQSTAGVEAGKVVALAEVGSAAQVRLHTRIGEVDRVLGGGVVPGEVVLLAGEPGIGKSTLVLQMATGCEAAAKSVLYVAGEESPEQIRLRIERLGLKPQQLKFLPETDVLVVQKTIEQEKPGLVIVDSIQTMQHPDVPSEAGSITQIRATASVLLQGAKQHHVPVILIGHVNKDGMVAGPKVLEHLVDCVLYLEGERTHPYRVLRADKNRFGSTNEVGVFDMQERGLEEVTNPSELFLDGRSTVSGSCVAALMEGSRALLIEVQALVQKTVFGMPMRKASGFDLNRLHVLLAVLEKRAGVPVSTQDVHVNVVGGLRVDDPGVDLAVCLAVASAALNKIIPAGVMAVGEVGLGGEVRPVARLADRVQEAKKLKFEMAVVPARGKLKALDGIQVKMVASVGEALKVVF